MSKHLYEVFGVAKPKRRHLYLVLDDWSKGYSVRKMVLPVDPDPFNPDLSADLPFNSARSALDIKRLPPAIFRFPAQRQLTRCFAAASFGSILAMLPVRTDPPGGHVLNVHKRTDRCCPLHEPNPAYPIYIPVDGGSIFALADDSFEMLSKPRNEDPESEDSGPVELGSRLKLETSKLVWRKLPAIPLPFDSKDVISYAVHSGENTLFVSTQDSTFIYNTLEVLQGATDNFQWDRLGADNNNLWDRRSKWVLPFIGRGHFDSDLQAWIGLSRELTGHLCSCEVFSAYPVNEVKESPAVKICKEFFQLNSHEKVVGATLIYCGVRSYYCLLQCISVDGKMKQAMSVDELQVQEQSMSVDEELEEQSLLRLWTFYVVYDKNGDLTVGDRRAQDYILPASVSEEFKKNPVGFWV